MINPDDMFPECATICGACEARGVVDLDGHPICLSCGLRQKNDLKLDADLERQSHDG